MLCKSGQHYLLTHTWSTYVADPLSVIQTDMWIVTVCILVPEVITFSHLFSIILCWRMHISLSSVKKNFTVFRLYKWASQKYESKDIYRVPRGKCARLRQNVPYVKVHRYNPKHLYPKLNGYGDNGERSLKVWQLLHTYWLTNTY